MLRKRDYATESSSSPLRALVVEVQEVSAAVAAQAHSITHDLSAILRDGHETTAGQLLVGYVCIIFSMVVVGCLSQMILNTDISFLNNYTAECVTQSSGNEV